MISVCSCPVSNYLCINLCISCFGMLQLFQDHHAGTFSDDETASVLVKRNGCAVRILAGAKGCQIGKSGYSNRTDCPFGTACQHHFCISVLNGTVCVTDAVGSGCTGRYHVGAFASGTCCNGYISRCHVADHLWNKKWINLRGSPFSQP